MSELVRMRKAQPFGHLAQNQQLVDHRMQHRQLLIQGAAGEHFGGHKKVATGFANVAPRMCGVLLAVSVTLIVEAR